MNLDFAYTAKGLEVSFRVLTKVPPKSIFEWDLGDDSGYFYNKKLPTYTYEKPGFYSVTLTVTNSNGYNESVSKQIIVTDKVKTHLSDSIYNLIDYYIPTELNQEMTPEDKELYINKWQLYIQPLVNHCVPIEEYNNELAYEGLENQLIMELAAWDYLNVRIMNLLITANEYVSGVISLKKPGTSGGDETAEEESESARGDRIKSIKTGPTEVEYYDTLSESGSSLFTAFSNALKPGGIIDELRKNLCTLASRLEIFLPFCENYQPIIPSRVRHLKRPGPFDVPNPRSVLRRR